MQPETPPTHSPYPLPSAGGLSQAVAAAAAPSSGVANSPTNSARADASVAVTPPTAASPPPPSFSSSPSSSSASSSPSSSSSSSSSSSLPTGSFSAAAPSSAAVGLRATPAADLLNGGATASLLAVPRPKKIKTKAHCPLSSFSLKSSKELGGLFAWLKAQTSVEKTDAEKALDSVPSGQGARQIVTQFSKVLRFLRDDATSADAVDWLAALRNHEKVTGFIAYLRKHEISLSTVINYLLACRHALRYLAQKDLSSADRATLDQTREWFVSLQRPYQKARVKETRKRNSRAAMESDGTWLPLSRLGEIAAAVELAADSLVTRIQSGGSDEIAVTDAVRYREMVIFLLLAKLCRPMIYTSLDVETWNKLPRDAEGRRWFASDAFKTSGCGNFGLDAVVVPVDVEARVETYIKIFRPVLVAARKQQAKDAPEWMFVTKHGERFRRLSTDIMRVVRTHAGSHLTITITSLRKALQTAAVDELTTEEARTIALNDKHSDSTAREHYEKKNALVEATRALGLQNRLTRMAVPPTAMNDTAASGTEAARVPPTIPNPTVTWPPAENVVPHESPKENHREIPRPGGASPNQTAAIRDADSDYDDADDDGDGCGAGEDGEDDGDDDDDDDDDESDGAAAYDFKDNRRSGSSDGDYHTSPSRHVKKARSSSSSPSPPNPEPVAAAAASMAPAEDGKAFSTPLLSTATAPAGAVATPTTTHSNSGVAAIARAAVSVIPTVGSTIVGSAAAATVLTSGAVRDFATTGAAPSQPAPYIRGTFTAEMDAKLLQIGARHPAPWAASKHAHPSLFGHVTPEQMRFRHRNLTKPNPATRSAPPRKRKYHAEDAAGSAAQQLSSAGSQRAAAARPTLNGSVRTHNTATAAAATAGGGGGGGGGAAAADRRCDRNAGAGRALAEITAAKVIGGRMYVRVKYRDGTDEHWVEESTVLHDPVYIRWLGP